MYLTLSYLFPKYIIIFFITLLICMCVLKYIIIPIFYKIWNFLNKFHKYFKYNFGAKIYNQVIFKTYI